MITFQLPNLESSYQHGEDIFIKAQITDDVGIEIIRIQITNELNQSFLHQIEFNDVGKQMTVDAFITHDDLYLNSGNYFVKITAKDSENETIAFREIQLIEKPTELKRIYVVRDLGGSTGFDTLSSSAVLPYVNLPINYTAGQVNARDNLLLLCNDDRLLVHNANSLDPILEYHNNTSTLLCNTFDETQRKFYSGTVDGYIFKTDEHGINSTFTFLPNQRVLQLVATDNFIFAYLQNFIQTERMIAVFQKSTGAFLQSIQVDFDLKKLIFTGNENMLVAIGNESGEGVLKYYNRSTNFFNSIFTPYNHSSINGAWPAGNNHFIVKHNDGLIAYTSNLQMQATGINLDPVTLVHERLSGLNYVANENGVYVLNTNATQQISFYPSSNCKDVLLLYNK